MAGRKGWGHIGAAALHRKYPSGRQTSSQLAAERRNLQKARGARGQHRHTHTTTYHGLRVSTARSRANAGAKRAREMRDIANFKTRPLGVRYMKYQPLAYPHRLRLTGVNKKFVSRVAPSRYMGRTSWAGAKQHNFKKRLTKRQHRFKQIKKWRLRGKRFTPR